MNNHEEFKYIGFNSETDKQKFEDKVHQVYSSLDNLLSEKYIVKNMVNVQDM